MNKYSTSFIGDFFFIQWHYKTTLPASTKFTLTVPWRSPSMLQHSFPKVDNDQSHVILECGSPRRGQSRQSLYPPLKARQTRYGCLRPEDSAERGPPFIYSPRFSSNKPHHDCWFCLIHLQKNSQTNRFIFSQWGRTTTSCSASDQANALNSHAVGYQRRCRPLPPHRFHRAAW